MAAPRETRQAPADKPLTYPQAVEQIRDGARCASCWLLLTDESLVLTRLARLMEEAVVPEHRDFNYQRLDCGDRRDEEKVSIGRCIAECEELPMMADRRLVWLRDVHALGDLSRLVDYVSDVPPSTVLFMTGKEKVEKEGEEGEAAATTPKKVGMTALAAAVQKLGVVIKGKLAGSDLDAWLDHELRERGITATADVVSRLRERVGENPSKLQTELDKITCYVGDRKSITRQDVDTMISPNLTAEIYEINNAVEKRDAGTALSVVSRLIDRDFHPLAILSTLANFHRELIKIKALDARGQSVTSIASTLKKSEKSLQYRVKSARGLTMRNLENRIDMLLRADQAAKSGKDARTVLELLILHLCR